MANHQLNQGWLLGSDCFWWRNRNRRNTSPSQNISGDKRYGRFLHTNCWSVLEWSQKSTLRYCLPGEDILNKHVRVLARTSTSSYARTENTELCPAPQVVFQPIEETFWNLTLDFSLQAGLSKAKWCKLSDCVFWSCRSCIPFSEYVFYPLPVAQIKCNDNFEILYFEFWILVYFFICMLCSYLSFFSFWRTGLTAKRISDLASIVSQCEHLK